MTRMKSVSTRLKELKEGRYIIEYEYNFRTFRIAKRESGRVHIIHMSRRKAKEMCEFMAPWIRMYEADRRERKARIQRKLEERAKRQATQHERESQ